MYLSYLKDVLGNNYIGINYFQHTVESYLDKLKVILGDSYDEYRQNQINRDGDTFHITVINTMEFNSLFKQDANVVNEFSKDFLTDFDDIQYMGIGTASSRGNTTYYIVCRSEKLNIYRSKYNLAPYDFHITLGFKWKDVFGVRKNEVMPEKQLFLDFLKKNYIDNNESFSFIKDIINYEYDKSAEILPIDIRESSADFRVNSNDYFTVSLINDEYLYITCKWQDVKDKPYLSNTIVNRRLNT